MNWIKENKFLAGLLVVLVLGIGAFGYLILNARGKLAAATEEYERQAAERTRLHNLKPYPSPENVKELVAQKEEATAKIMELHKALAAAQLPVEPMSPAQFQDKLRDSVTKVKERAGAATAFKDAEKFFLGFDRYETTTPDAAAAPLLGRQLKAIQWLVTRFIENRATEIRELVRDPLPEEGGKAREESAPATPAKGGKGKVEKPSVPLVVPHGIEIKVFGEPSGLRTVLNEIVAAKDQFYIIRSISFLNEKDKAPSRTVAAPAGGEGAPADGSAPATSSTPPSGSIVGEEKVELTLRLEMVEFAVVPKLEAK